MHHYLTTALEIAEKAGNSLKRYFARLDTIEIQRKGHNDLVTTADHEAEQILLDGFRHAYPDHGFIAEESGETDSDKEWVWIIDPLDGTTNFAHGFPQWCISIALRHGEQIKHAMIYDPIRNDIYHATLNDGAFLNNRRIRCSKHQKIESSFLGTGFPYREHDNIEYYLETLNPVLRQAQSIRRAGSAALDLSFVAAGIFDGFWEMNLKIWDIAAGCLLVKEAGGRLFDFEGGEDYLNTGCIIASNNYLYRPLIDIIRPAHMKHHQKA